MSENMIVESTNEALPTSAPSEFVNNFRECYKLANVLSKSKLIPVQYQNKPEDCVIAIDLANRMGVSPIMVMQSLYVVKGKPSWSGQACMSFIRAKYVSANPIYTGIKGTETRGCYIKAITSEGDVIEGTEVTIGMAKAEGWMSNSKWKNIPELMLAYRAAAFFARVYCPEVLMGIFIEGEAEDSTRKIEKAPDIFGDVNEQA